MFTDHQSPEAAVRKLAGAGIDMKNLSVVGKGYHTDEQVATLTSRTELPADFAIRVGRCMQIHVPQPGHQIR